MSSDISIVLSAYNGHRYIEEQMESLLGQTVLPKVIRVVDDCSSDGTSALLAGYESSRSDLVSLEVNGKNKGWRQNFYDLIVGSGGSLIFPCDQDDIWMPDKLEVMSGHMDRHPEIDVLACAVDPFGDEVHGAAGGRPVPRRFFVQDDLAMLDLCSWTLYVQRPGCSYCIRKSFVDQVKRYWDPTWAHDGFLWRFAAAKGTLGIINERLIRFRRHGDNASERKKISNQSRVGDVEHYIAMLSAIRRFALESGEVTPESLGFAERAISWLESRRQFLRNSSVGPLKKMISGRSLYATPKGLYVDVALGLFKRLTI